MTKRDRLQEVVKQFSSLNSIHQLSQKRALDNPAQPFVSNIGLNVLGKRPADARKEIARHFQDIGDRLTDAGILALIVTFEQQVFYQISQASGSICKVVKKHYIPPEPFSGNGRGFVKDKDDMRNLGGVKALLNPIITQTLSDQLSEILDHRNWLAHGGRIGSKSKFDINKMCNILTEILDRIDHAGTPIDDQ